MELKRAFDFLYHQAELYPKADCLNIKENGKWKNYSTQQVISIVNAVSAGLLEIGIRPGDRIAIISTNRPEWNFIDLGVQQIGAIGVPMYPTITIEDYRYIFGHAEVKMIFVGNEDLFRKSEAAAEGMDVEGIFTFDRVPGARHWMEVYEKGLDKHQEEVEKLKAAVKPEDLLTIIYTSGTTGVPKGVMLSHTNIVTNAIAVADRSPIERGKSRSLSFLPLCHIYERTGIYYYFYQGVSVYYAESMETIGENLKEVKPHMFNTVPRLLEKVYDKIVAKGHELTGVKKKLFFWALDLGHRHIPNEDQGAWYNMQLKLANKIIFSKWREALGNEIIVINSGAAALQPRLARVFWAAGIRICEGYGLTETSPVITATVPTHQDVRIGSVGPTIADVEIKIAPDGEILCKGPNVMIGYYKQPELTEQVLKDGWFHTGDIGEITEGRFLRITDRKKEMFKTSGGKYIAPQVMENKFKESYLIEQIAIIGENRKFPSALIVPFFDGLKEWCNVNNIRYTTDTEMVKHPDVMRRYDEEVNKYNEQFGSWEKIKKFTLMGAAWSIEGGELTPTLKLKRRIINQKYQQEIEAIYA